MRVEIVEECAHGRTKRHIVDPCSGPCLIPQDHDDCDGGKRRVLTEGEFLLIEKVDGEWPYVLSDEVHRILTVLAGGSDG